MTPGYIKLVKFYTFHTSSMNNNVIDLWVGIDSCSEVILNNRFSAQLYDKL